MSVRSQYWYANTRLVADGDAVRVADQNRTHRALAALQWINNRVKTEQRRSWAETMLHQVTGIQGDYLECLRVWRNDTLGSEVVYVAKPPLLRGSLTSRDGVTYVYTGADAQARTASKVGETDEDHEMTPKYIVGDIIEVTIKRGLTGITEVDEQRGRPIDKNVDGRAWAKVPDP